MKKILKNLEPFIRTYLGDAFCFSIINDIAFETGWVYDKYIHLEYTPCDGQIKYKDYDYYDFVSGEGVFIKSFLEYPFLYCNEEIIIEQVMQMIENSEYCFALWDETIVTNYLLEERKNGIYEHGCFVYGFDDDKRIFYTQGYINAQWEHFTIPYDVFYKAISYCPQKGEIALIGYKVRENYHWEFNYDKMKVEVGQYSKRSLSDSYEDNYDANAIYQFFCNLSMGQPIHYPSVYCIYEHKSIFAKRISYLIQKGYLEENGSLELAEELVTISKKIMLLVLRYNEKFECDLFGVIYKEVKKMMDTERKMMLLLN